MPRRVGDFRGLTQLSRLRLLYAVQRRPGTGVDDLAAHTGLHPNTVREHLAVLEDEGLVTSRSKQTGRRGRPPKVFEAVQHASDNPVARQRIAGARERGDRWRAIDEGNDIPGWGPQAQHQLDTLYEHLDDAGLQPRVDEEGLTIEVVPCEYLRALHEDPLAVCTVHVELVHQQLAQVPGPLRLRSVHPFVTPNACTLTLTHGQGEDERGPQTNSGAPPAQS